MARFAITACAAIAVLALPCGVDAAQRTSPRTTFRPPPPKEGFHYPDCYCTDSEGRRVEMGERACLRIGPREFTAMCAMSQNSPTWRTQEEGCPVS